MNKNSFAKSICELTLNRDKNYLLTTGDVNVDKAFGLSHEVLYGNPSIDTQINFGALVYLSGLFGGKVVNFTATPFGFLYEMDFNGNQGLHVVAENELKSTENNFLGFNVDDLIQNIQYYKILNNLNENETYFCDYVTRRLKESDSKTMTDILKSVSLLIKENPNIFKSFRKNLREARDSFRSVNKNNCEINELMLFDILYASHDRNVTEEYLLNRELSTYLKAFNSYDKKELNIALELLDISKEDKNKALNLLNKLKNNDDEYIMAKEVLGWIMDGYFTHRGYNRDGENVAKDRAVITKRAIDKNSKYKKIFGQDLKKILNMCTTDYTADRVYDVVAIYADSSINDIENGTALTKVIDAVETVDDNKELNYMARKSFYHNITTEK